MKHTPELSAAQVKHPELFGLSPEAGVARVSAAIEKLKQEHSFLLRGLQQLNKSYIGKLQHMTTEDNVPASPFEVEPRVIDVNDLSPKQFKKLFER